MKILIDTNVVLDVLLARGIVRRDRDGFRKAQCPVYTPGELIASHRTAR